MHVCKYLNQRVRRIGESYGKSFKGFSKKEYQEIEFHNSVKEFLLLVTGRRKVLGKMPG